MLSHVRLFMTPSTAAHQASLSFTISQSLLKLMSIESVMSSNHLFLCLPLLILPSIFPSIGIFSNELAFCSSIGQSTGASASASVLPMNIQSWFPLGLTGLISLQSKGLSRVFSSTTKQWCNNNWGERERESFEKSCRMYPEQSQPRTRLWDLNSLAYITP